VESLGNFNAPTGFDFSEVRVRHERGGRFRVLFTLSNEGPMGVTITRIGPGPETEEWGLPFVSMTTAPIGGRERPFRPFSLAGRGKHFVDVRVTVQMKGCLSPDTSTSLRAVPITYRVLGFTRHTTVYLPESIEVVGSPGETCS